MRRMFRDILIAFVIGGTIGGGLAVAYADD
jgi:hypothetical protein